MNPAFLARAIELAVANVRAGRGGPFGAVVVQHGRIVGEGANSVIPLNDPTAHAEVVAIRNACQALGTVHISDCQIYSSCEPCPMCLGAIYWAHIEKLFFAATQHDAARAGFDDSFIYQELALAAEARRIPMVHVPLGDEAFAPFREWLQREDRIPY